MVKRFSKKYGNKGIAFNYLQSLDITFRLHVVESFPLFPTSRLHVVESFPLFPYIYPARAARAG